MSSSYGPGGEIVPQGDPSAEDQALIDWITGTRASYPITQEAQYEPEDPIKRLRVKEEDIFEAHKILDELNVPRTVNELSITDPDRDRVRVWRLHGRLNLLALKLKEKGIADLFPHTEDTGNDS